MNEKLEKLYTGKHLEASETKQLFEDIFAGKLDPVLFSSLLTALKMNGYTAQEIGGAASAMKEAAEPFERDQSLDVGEIVGTGGDKLKTINISTLAGIVCATLGTHIAKHGNTAVSSKTGASDVLTALGYDIRCDKDLTRKNLEEEGFAFFFAQKYHTGMRFAAPIRKALGTSTIFNILGPLGNPAHVNYELLGCYDVKMLDAMARALKITGVSHGLVVNGNGMDEISIFGQTNYVELFEDGHLEQGVLTNADFGIRGEFSQKQLEGGTPEENATTARTILEGKGTDAHNAVVAANAAGLLHLSGKAPVYKDGFEMAMEVLKSGRAADKLDTICRISNGQF